MQDPSSAPIAYSTLKKLQTLKWIFHLSLSVPQKNVHVDKMDSEKMLSYRTSTYFYSGGTKSGFKMQVFMVATSLENLSS